MPAWLAKPADYTKSAWNIILSVGPWLISQTEASSEAWARHQGRLAAVDVSKEFLMQEVHTLGETKKIILQKWVEADPSEKVRIKRDLEEIESSLRGLKVAGKALNYLPEPMPTQANDASEPPSNDAPQAEITAHWMDRFRDMARAHNEQWREELLARALATESTNPGSVSPRTLWIIGTLEEQAFHAFSSLIDISTKVGNGWIIPQISSYNINEKPIPDCALGGNPALGALVYLLGDTGLLAEGFSQKHFDANIEFVIGYSETCFTLKGPSAAIIAGVLFSKIGSELARFYEPKFNKLGEEIFEAWVAEMKSRQFVTRRVAPIGDGRYTYLEPAPEKP